MSDTVGRLASGGRPTGVPLLPDQKQLVEIVEVGRPGDLREGLPLILQLTGASLRDVFEARTALEPMMAHLAATRMTREQLAELESTVTRMRENPDDHELFLAENQRFHGIVADATGSAILRVFNETLKSIADGAVVGVTYTARRRAAVARAHERVVEALRRRDPEAAEEAMRAHVGEAGEYWWRKYPELVSRGVRWAR
ncbi:MAG TPA: FCD domain-containing protein [Mycobacteriales bacterium]